MTMLKIKLVRSPHGAVPSHRKSVRGLGLRRMHQERLVVDTPQNRGMINQVCYMVDLLEEGVSMPSAKAEEGKKV